VAVPIAIILALALARSRTPSTPSQAGASGVVSVAPVPSNPATVEPCAQVLAALPLQLNGANPRIVLQLQAVAWGSPAIILRCGVARPAALSAGSTAQIPAIDGLSWLIEDGTKAIVYTLVDRSVYVEVTLPAGTDPSSVMPVLSDDIAHALPTPVCYVQDKIASLPGLPMCTRR
jgi:hypothetical protein